MLSLCREGAAESDKLLDIDHCGGKYFLAPLNVASSH
jgi:hypothetical protein